MVNTTRDTGNDHLNPEPQLKYNTEIYAELKASYYCVGLHTTHQTNLPGVNYLMVQLGSIITYML